MRKRITDNQPESLSSREREMEWEWEMGMRMGNGNKNRKREWKREREFVQNLHSTQGSDETLGLMVILFTSIARDDSDSR